MLRYKSIQSDGGAYGSITDGDAVGIANAASKFLTHEKSVTRLSDLEIMTLIKYNVGWSTAALQDMTSTVF